MSADAAQRISSFEAELDVARQNNNELQVRDAVIVLSHCDCV